MLVDWQPGPVIWGLRFRVRVYRGVQPGSGVGCSCIVNVVAVVFLHVFTNYELFYTCNVVLRFEPNKVYGFW